MKTNFDVCCESIEKMAQVIDIMKCGWTKEQVLEWLKQPFTEAEEERKIIICYMSDIPSRIKNSRKILERMEAGHIIKKHENGFITDNAEYRFIDCRHPEEYMGAYADQAIIDFREPMREIAEIVTASSCVPENRIIDDRCIGTMEQILTFSEDEGMDIEKAIGWLKAISATQNESIHKNSLSERKEALYMAIKALEKQKELKENCDGNCSDCLYCGDNRCANDLLIDGLN